MLFPIQGKILEIVLLVLFRAAVAKIALSDIVSPMPILIRIAAITPTAIFPIMIEKSTTVITPGHGTMPAPKATAKSDLSDGLFISFSLWCSKTDKFRWQ